MKTDIPQEFKDAGFVYKEITEEQKKHPKYIKALKICEDDHLVNLREIQE